MKTNNKLNKIRSKAKDVCVWIVIGLVIGCIVGWSTHTAIYNITHKEPEVSVGYVTGKLENIGELATQKLTYSGRKTVKEKRKNDKVGSKSIYRKNENVWR